MELGMLMMPLHRPERPFLTVLREDQDAIILADELGFAEVYVGEHYSNKPELDHLAVHLPRHPDRADEADQARYRCDQPAAAAPGDRRRPCRDVRSACPRPLHLRHRARRLARRLRDVQAEQPAGPAEDDAGVDRDDPENLDAGAALRVPRRLLGFSDQGRLPQRPRRRRHGPAVPDAAPAHRRLDHEPPLEQRPHRRRARLDPDLGELHPGLPREDPLGGLCRRLRSGRAPARARDLACRPQHPRDRERRRGRGLSGRPRQRARLLLQLSAHGAAGCRLRRSAERTTQPCRTRRSRPNTC